jgi:hypothetical protein
MKCASIVKFSFYVSVSTIAIASATSAGAVTTFIYSNETGNNLAALGANDVVDWRQLGVAGTVLPSTFTALSTGGLGVTGSFGTTANRIDQRVGFSTPSDPLKWNGDFAGGAALIASANEPSNDIIDAPGSILPDLSPLVLAFDRPVSGVGAQINAAHYGKFTGSIAAFDRSGNLLASFNNSNITNDGRTTPLPVVARGSIGTDTYGRTTNDANDVAYFWGIKSDRENISKIVFGTNRESLLDNANNPVIDYGTNYFAINNLRLSVAPATAVPEPLTLFGTLVGGAIALRMQRRLSATNKL